MSNIHIAYGSESGNAKRLALQLKKQLNEPLDKTLQSLNPSLCELNDIVLTELNSQDVLLIISSSFGDGESPANGAVFFDRLQENIISINCQFAVFGLGDVSYDKFCGFTIDLDNQLRQLGATAIAERVDADISYELFFKQWSEALQCYFEDNKELLSTLKLQVKSYGDDSSFIAKAESVQHINQGEFSNKDFNQSGFPVYDIQIDITGSDMNYQAGDLLYVLPPVNQPTFQRVLAFYGSLTNNLSDKQKDQLSKKELHQLSKPLIRAVVKQTKNTDLKALTKMSASKKLADYMYGRDVADLLNDYCTADNMPFEVLMGILSNTLPRAYSIASCGSSSPNLVRLCVREVSYTMNDNQYIGTGSSFLCHANETADETTPIRVYIRANSHFHLPKNNKTPIIMIGSGTGIAPYLGFLSSEQAKQRTGETHLFFGERYRATDYLYEQEIANYLKSGQLTAIYTAFSREQAEKIYVQDVFLQQGEKVWELLQQGGEIYVCGSKANLSKPMAQALATIAQNCGNLSEDDAKNYSNQLVSEQRYHLDLY